MESTPTPPNAVLLGSFPDQGVLDRHTLGFSVYASSAKRRKVVVAETGLVELTAQSLDDCPVKYAVAVRRKGEDTLTVVPAEAFRFSTVVKSQKDFQSALIGSKNLSARDSLGEAFGTAKRRQAIRSIARNQVNANALQSVQGFLSKKLDETAVSAPTPESLKALADVNRPIPPFDMQAESPADVYKIQDIVPDAYLKLLNVKRFATVKSKEELKQLIGGPEEFFWVTERIFLHLQTGRPDESYLKRLLFLNLMVELFKTRKFKDYTTRPFQEVREYLLAQFTTIKWDGKINKIGMPERLKDKLLGYLMCLALILEDYQLNIDHFTKEIALKATAVDRIARELGCKIETRSINGVLRRMAVLSVPLKFPEVRKIRK
ncbi:RNA polymerase I associated factor, A49-like protein [Zopfochytrium polystomum]|nr:RNA polymerase I associated factor, A49-like protein [Zopfochytrium polystomum]